MVISIVLAALLYASWRPGIGHQIHEVQGFVVIRTTQQARSTTLSSKQGQQCSSPTVHAQSRHAF